MASWVLVPCLVQLREEFNRIAPGRDKASDGSIGDTAHQDSVSDHNRDEEGNVPIRDADKTNEVHAIDVDADLRESDLTMEKVVDFLLFRCREGKENRLRYIIYNRRIWSASNDWAEKAYTGENAHDKHAHFSASYTTSLESDTRSWHLEDIPVALSSNDRTFITDTIQDEVKKATSALQVELEKFIEARTGDAVPRWNADGTSVPADDANPKIWLSTAANQIGRTVARIENDLADLSAKVDEALADDDTGTDGS